MMNLSELVDLAQRVESEDPIEWGLLTISENDTYSMLGSSILEQYMEWLKDPDKDKIMLATILKLVVENFVLNYEKLTRMKNNG